MLGLLRPYIARWFRQKYGSPTPPQRMAIPRIKAGENVLISSPTGTGKTLAAFLAIIDTLYELWDQGRLENSIYALYVSPLRALNNDIRRNLLEPIREINEILRSEGREPPHIRIAVRTSDTPPHEKQKMLREPPHILITTPESLAIAITAPKFREVMRSIRWVIIDEIHELASSKRGSHLMLSIERLVELLEREPQRIGLSATIYPLEVVAQFLVGFDNEGKPRKCSIVDARFAKPIDIRVICPAIDLIRAPADEINNSIYNTLADLIKRYRTTLIFTNTRHSTEKVVYRLKKIFEKDPEIKIEEIEAHHSSLSREVRLDVEERLKRGELRVVVSSTSLELGIDIGYIDVVALLSSPKSVTRLLQRVGRAGHHIRQISLGRLVVVDRDDLVECTVLAKAAMERKLDRVRIPMKPLDVLAQHIVGMSLEKKWRVEDMFRVIRRAYPYKDLDFETFQTVLRYLSGGYEIDRYAKVYSKIWMEDGMVGRKRSARMIYYLNTGAIPDEAKIRVIAEGKGYVGDLDEGFAEILEPEDIFVLGGKTYKVLRTDGDRIYVKPAEGMRPTVPSWFSEMLPLAFDSALEVGRFRRIIAEDLSKHLEDPTPVVKKLVEEYMLEEHAAINIVNYFLEHLYYTGWIMPSDKLIMIEHWIDPEANTEHIIFHTLFGRRVNDVLSRAYAHFLSEIVDENIRITVTDNGFMLSLPSVVGISNKDLEKILYSVTPENLDEVLRKVIRRTEMFKKRFRHVAERSFMILKRFRGRDISLQSRQINAETLIRIVEEMERFPVIEETYREILEDYMDIENARLVIKKILGGEIEVKIYRNPEGSRAPSPLAHSIVAAGISDVVLMEDKRKILAKLHENIISALIERGIVLRSTPSPQKIYVKHTN
ncbi:MAG: ATP-dependent helicase [Sulfolobales archaeon]